ncbi:DUF4625 domain-containing protein [Mucilaginibacter sp. UR6-1]|uniref:DUF4625 domain-containing protein n=1 Tax=Mucilaginibacter sp. UR6-1 TaxID=1435643 RepID=UPI001E4BF829|nr:DUF4625 domain-containing protein [Mucilaginibacter sp. UR6-1]MCC8409811.1 DUF4625 domain-containing protein [Mucilaginibacter sp. UR6-1]
MKTTKQLICLLLAGVTLFSACSKDDNETPVGAPAIEGLEVGANNNKIAHPGNDLHIEAQITAAANIKDVVLEIHPENGSGWEVNTTYTEGFAGLKNAEFHKHIDVPADAAVGDYHGHLKVTDQNGRVTEAEFELKVEADPTLPSVTGFEVGYGNDLHVEATVAAPNKIAQIVVEVHGNDFEKEVVYTDAAMVGQTTYNLHKHVDVAAAPAGHYHVHLKVVDQAGKENEFEEHFDKP